MSEDYEWTAKTVQTVIQRPERLLDDQIWRQRLQEFGGLGDFYHWLNQLPLEQPQQSLLKVLTTYPGAPVDSYCQMLNIHQATYHRYQKALFEQIARVLNQPHQNQPNVPNLPADRAPIHQLRPAVGDFVGRETELQRLTYAIQVAHEAKRSAALVGIHGMGGIGKSELSLIVAQHVLNLYPDAQLILNMYGAREQALTTEQALGLVINALDPKARLPEKREQLLARYHNVLHNKRVLIVVDDARDADQVRDLIPPVGCCLIITSRQRFSLPAMLNLQLEALNAPNAINLVQAICPRLDQDSAEQLAIACNYLPLALRVSASILQNNPALKPEQYLNQLADQSQRLQALRDPDDPQLNVEASLALSYAQLSPEQQYFMRQLAVLVADFSSAIGLAMLELPHNLAAENQLYYLLRHNLLQYDGHNERWSMHDLIRSFARNRLIEQQEQATAQIRYVQVCIDQAQQLHQAYRHAVLATIYAYNHKKEHFDYCLAWLANDVNSNQYIQQMLDLVHFTATVGHHSYNYQQERGIYVQKALEAAYILDQPSLIANNLRLMGNVKRYIGDLPAAISYLEQSLDLAYSIDSAQTIANSANDLATIYGLLGGKVNHQKALELYQKALSISRITNDRYEMCNQINNIGTCYANMGMISEAEAYFSEAHELAQAAGNMYVQLLALTNLGQAAVCLNQAETALPHLYAAIEIADQTGNKKSKGCIFGSLAEAYWQLHDQPAAFTAHEQAIVTFEQQGYGWEAANAQWQYGLTLVEAQQIAPAQTLFAASLDYRATINDPALERDRQLFEQLKAGQIAPTQFLTEVKALT